MNAKLNNISLHDTAASTASLDILMDTFFPACDKSKIPSALKGRLEAGIQAALEAGKIIWNGRASSDFDVHHKGIRDLMTTVDVNAEKAIISGISKYFPSDIFLAEESSPLLEKSSENNTDHLKPTWIIDPLDGTTNFVRGHVHCATSIAFSQEGKLQLGIVYAPFLNIMYLGIRGQGSFDQEKKLCVSTTQELNQALVATGFPYDRSNVKELLDKVSVILNHCADLRRNGAAALDLCHVANGTVDAYIETVMPWDMAAGLIIALEAGAEYANSNVPQQPAEYLNAKNLVVATPGVFSKLFSKL